MVTSRPALVAVLAGFLLIAAVSAAVAMSGTGEGNATASQYPADEEQGEVLSNRSSGQSGGGNRGESPGSGGPNISGLTAQEEGVQQVAVQGQGGGLPLTGFAAIPLLLIGAGLLVTGVVTRRRLSDALPE